MSGVPSTYVEDLEDVARAARYLLHELNDGRSPDEARDALAKALDILDANKGPEVFQTEDEAAAWVTFAGSSIVDGSTGATDAASTADHLLGMYRTRRAGIK